MEGFSKVTAGMVLTWRRPKAPSLKKMGRQVDRNFELEVLRECEKASNNHMQNGGSGMLILYNSFPCVVIDLFSYFHVLHTIS